MDHHQLVILLTVTQFCFVQLYWIPWLWSNFKAPALAFSTLGAESCLRLLILHFVLEMETEIPFRFSLSSSGLLSGCPWVFMLTISWTKTRPLEGNIINICYYTCFYYIIQQISFSQYVRWIEQRIQFPSACTPNLSTSLCPILCQSLLYPDPTFCISDLCSRVSHSNHHMAL